MTPARRHTAVENLTFSTPSGHLYKDMEHSLWSDSFTSNRGAMQVSAALFPCHDNFNFYSESHSLVCSIWQSSHTALTWLPLLTFSGSFTLWSLTETSQQRLAKGTRSCIAWA